MKTLKRRIALHFSIQFIALLCFLFTFMIVLIFVIAQYITNQDIKTKPLIGITEAISVETMIDENGGQLKEHWQKILRENNMWLQILNEDGFVIYSENAPSELQAIYSTPDLLLIEKNRRIGNYQVHSEITRWNKKNYYYVVGREDPMYTQLKDWYLSYHSSIEELEDSLREINSFITIYKNGELFQTIGAHQEITYSPLELVQQTKEPGKYETMITTYHDQELQTTWILHTPNDTFSEPSFFLFKNEALFIFISCAIVLIIAVILSWWHGYRYGRPLLLFIHWLDLVGKGEYQSLLTEKEQKKVFRKNGKIKARYRLYSEVFISFNQVIEKLTNAENERLKLEQSREDWMTGISHDLRTPLSTIQGYSHMLESNQYNFSNEELVNIGKVMREKGDYMLSLVNDFSLVFMLKNSAISLNKEAVEINGFIHSIIEKYEQDLTITQANFSLSRTDNDCFLLIDRTWFKRVLDNLLTNALKHNRLAILNIKVIVEQTTKQTMVSIQDDGKGMDKKTIEHLFTRYYRGTNTDERNEGVGLGMSIAKEIIELHGGEIIVNSEIDVGTKISLIFKHS